MHERYVIVPRDHPDLPTEHGDFNVQGPSVVRTPPWLLDVSVDDDPDAAGRWLFYAAAGEFSLGVTRLDDAT
ncbi:MAG: hypothetical protein QF777_00750 [Acidimicrobiales bacterium]|jgi:hypothetical protein|nr:hypothetical protein [Actinomycetes bacterium]MDP6910078.1 hypothetical protein [Acidimicrobiales bacterium]HCW01634.1 hypothetical protein [Acidimicrobiaceae bacterium]|tara:strand:+ start:2338 stop:2553 length:216 start_codon:yes stop_codon:yes gene_type:complete